jgi:hypothetical protein
MSSTIVMSFALLVVNQPAPRPAAQADPEVQPASAETPTPIRLDFDDRTLEEIVAALNAQSPIGVMLPPEPAPAPPGALPRPLTPPRRFTLHERDPVSFWEAIDRVCHMAGRWPGIAILHDPHAPVPTTTERKIERDPMVVLLPASGDRGYVHVDGLFRVVVAGLSYGRDIRFTPALFPQPGVEKPSQDRPGDDTFFSADLIVMVEPRWKIERVGQPALREAIDNLGHDLIVAGSARQPPSAHQGLILPDAAAVTVPLPLAHPRDHGTLIKRLSGRMSLQVSTRSSPSRTIAADVAFHFADVPMP